jgi:hypothetical protein
MPRDECTATRLEFVAARARDAFFRVSGLPETPWDRVDPGSQAAWIAAVYAAEAPELTAVTPEPRATPERPLRAARRH